jgi:hypothetical protein
MFLCKLFPVFCAKGNIESRQVVSQNSRVVGVNITREEPLLDVAWPLQISYWLVLRISTSVCFRCLLEQEQEMANRQQCNAQQTKVQDIVMEI